MKPIRLTQHARDQCKERGTKEAEVRQAIQHGSREPAKKGGEQCRFNFPYGRSWQGNDYAIKQVARVIKEKRGRSWSLPFTLFTFER
ncbi:DUF4258 domain-containing protein [Cytophagia bacterium CHB2]|nr:DUF4258 domain-containing protein [Cytophagia bacterium CHB2]